VCSRRGAIQIHVYLYLYLTSDFEHDTLLGVRPVAEDGPVYHDAYMAAVAYAAPYKCTYLLTYLLA